MIPKRNYKDLKMNFNIKNYNEIITFIEKEILKTEGKWFSGKTLFGNGIKWSNIPIGTLYDNRVKFYEEKGITDPNILDAKATKQAGKDLGYILLRVIIDSKYSFERKKNWTWEYRLINKW